MAQNLQSLKKRIKTAQNISQIARAMEMIAASKIKKAQKAVANNRPYSDKITEILNRMISCAGPDAIEHTFMELNPGVDRKLVIALSSDRGLAGSLPSNLCRKLLDFEPSKTDVVAVGKKVERFAAKSGYNLIASFPFGTVFPEYSIIFPLTGILTGHYKKKLVSEVHILFTEFRSVFSLAPTAFKLLPVVPPLCEDDGKALPYKFEPGQEYILRELIPYYVEIKLYNAIVQAYTSEQAARMVSMGGAKENALDIMQFLTLSYNKTRQERITNEILDLANGRMS
jgi:F-type H+-transporting ATPase subunit gamma